MLKDHMPTLAMLIALFMLLIALCVMALSSRSTDEPLLIGLGGAITTIVGAIAGKQIAGASNGTPAKTTPTASALPAPIPPTIPDQTEQSSHT